MGFSFFVIVAALAITGMLFQFFPGTKKPANRTVSRAVGWKTIKIRLVYWGEGLLTGSYWFYHWEYSLQLFMEKRFLIC